MPIAPDSRVTAELARFINECERLEPDDTGSLYPYADKSGYHNTVERNLERWPGEYSTKLADDLRGNRKVCRAFDWISESARTRGDRTVMNRYGRRLRDAYLRRDPRFKGWREVLTQVDAGQPEGFNVGPGGWYTRTPDMSHDYHHHLSKLTAYVADWPTYAGMLSILAGEPLESWLAGKSRYLTQQEDDMAEVPQADWDALDFLARALRDGKPVMEGSTVKGAPVWPVVQLRAITSKLDALLGRPALVVTPELVEELAERIGLVLAERQDNPVSHEHLAAVKQAIVELLRDGIGSEDASQ